MQLSLLASVLQVHCWAGTLRKFPMIGFGSCRFAGFPLVHYADPPAVLLFVVETLCVPGQRPSGSAGFDPIRCGCGRAS